MLAATLALAGLAFVDIVFLLPLLITAVVLALGLGITLVAIGALGVKIIVTALLFDSGTLTATLGRLFIGAGLVSGMLGGGALLLLGSSAGIRVLGRYARLHSRITQSDRNQV